MKKLIHVLASALLFTTASIASAADKDDLYYAPVILAYMNGDFMSLAQVALPIQGKHECLEKLQQLISGAQEKGNVPAGGSMIGGCLPIPPAPTAASAS